MLKRVLSIFICTAVFLSISLPAYADPLSGSSETSASASEQEKIEDLEDSISRLDNDIIEYMEQMKVIEEEIKLSEERVSQKEAELKQAQEEVKASKELFGKRMRYLYENDYERGYLYVLITSESFSDFISRLTTLKTILEYDNKIVSKLREREDEIDSQRTLLLEENSRLQNNKRELEDKIVRLNSLKDNQENLIKTLRTRISARASAPSFTLPSRGGGVNFNNEVISFAAKFLGTPYHWGGNSPEEGFDCSGFTQYVFANFGVSLDRTSSSQARQGIPVSYSELQPGDLVFYGSPVYHVGIYVGNDQFIHAPHRGEVVKIAPIVARYYSTARRVR